MADLSRATFQLEKRKPPLSAAWQAPNLLVALVVATAPPICNATVGGLQHPSHRLSANPDTSRGTPKPLTEDAYQASGMPESQAPQRRPSQPLDTSYRNVALLTPVVTAAPQPGAPFAGAQRLEQLLLDTSLSTPLGLRTTLVLDPVFGKATSSAPGRYFPVFDTSAETPKPLTLDAEVPRQNPPFPVLDRRRPVVDTSAGTPYALRAFVPPEAVPPGPFVVAIRKPWLPADTSRGTPKGLTLDATKPTFNAPPFAPVRKFPVWDTSKGIDLALATTIPLPPPPGSESFCAVPDHRRAFWLTAFESRQPIAPTTILKPVGDPFMATRIQVAPKLPLEVRAEVFDASPFLEIGQSISSVAGAIGVYSGTDPDPGAMLTAVTFSGSDVTARLEGGVQGVIYIVTIYISATGPTETIPVSFFLAIAPELP